MVSLCSFALIFFSCRKDNHAVNEQLQEVIDKYHITARSQPTQPGESVPSFNTVSELQAWLEQHNAVAPGRKTGFVDSVREENNLTKQVTFIKDLANSLQQGPPSSHTMVLDDSEGGGSCHPANYNYTTWVSVSPGGISGDNLTITMNYTTANPTGIVQYTSSNISFNSYTAANQQVRSAVVTVSGNTIHVSATASCTTSILWQGSPMESTMTYAISMDLNTCGNVATSSMTQLP